MTTLNYQERSVAEKIAARLTSVTGVQHDAVKAPIGWNVHGPKAVPGKPTEAPSSIKAAHTTVLKFQFISHDDNWLMIKSADDGKNRWIKKDVIESFDLTNVDGIKIVSVVVDAALAKKRGWVKYAIVK